MISLSLLLNTPRNCPYCLHVCDSSQIAFQGIHWGIRTFCSLCQKEFFFDAPVGHAGYDGYAVDCKNGAIFGPPTGSVTWFAQPLAQSLINPSKESVPLTIERFSKHKSVIVLSCLDYLYGHCLLKLLNAERHLRENPELGLIVIVPAFLRWCVPRGVAEIWTVSIGLRKMQTYFPELETKILHEISKYTHVHISKAYSHPHPISIEQFTNVTTHNFRLKLPRVTFIWRNDRPWFSQFHIAFLARKLKLLAPILAWQRIKIIILFFLIHRNNPHIRCTVAGIGREGRFPKWISDERTTNVSATAETRLCKVYSESRVVVGVHGSNMLLPSAHAGMMINLLPSDRQGNFAQDVLYSQTEAFAADPRLISFRYRFLDIQCSVFTVAKIVTSLLKDFPKTIKYYQPIH